MNAERQERSATKQDLINKMHDLAEEIGPPAEKDSARVGVQFAKLLLILSEEAKEATQETITMHRRLVWLTWALLAVTVALLVKAMM